MYKKNAESFAIFPSMILKHFVFNPFGVNCFVISNDAGDAILIDPSVSNELEQEALSKYIADNHLTVRRLVNTHLHLDHILGNAFVERTYGIKAEAHQEDEFLLDLQEEQSSLYGLPFEDPAPALGDYIAEGDSVEIPGVKLHVLHVAGHSPGGVALYSEKTNVHDSSIKSPSFEVPLLFSGDILFAGSRGRSDLFGGDDHALVTGIKQKLLTLPDDTVVLPGHGPSTTIGDEKFNY